jgi:hypothetical protein
LSLPACQDFTAFQKFSNPFNSSGKHVTEVPWALVLFRFRNKSKMRVDSKRKTCELIEEIPDVRFGICMWPIYPGPAIAFRVAAAGLSSAILGLRK